MRLTQKTPFAEGLRICSVATGNYEYPNSGGGTGHAIKIVGMFDLPANKTP